LDLAQCAIRHLAKSEVNCDPAFGGFAFALAFEQHGLSSNMLAEFNVGRERQMPIRFKK
jgi:hypothetical protein